MVSAYPMPTIYKSAPKEKSSLRDKLKAVVGKKSGTSSSPAPCVSPSAPETRARADVDNASLWSVGSYDSIDRAKERLESPDGNDKDSSIMCIRDVRTYRCPNKDDGWVVHRLKYKILCASLAVCPKTLWERREKDYGYACPACTGGSELVQHADPGHIQITGGDYDTLNTPEGNLLDLYIGQWARFLSLVVFAGEAGSLTSAATNGRSESLEELKGYWTQMQEEDLCKEHSHEELRCSCDAQVDRDEMFRYNPASACRYNINERIRMQLMHDERFRRPDLQRLFDQVNTNQKLDLIRRMQSRTMRWVNSCKSWWHTDNHKVLKIEAYFRGTTSVLSKDEYDALDECDRVCPLCCKHYYDAPGQRDEPRSPPVQAAAVGPTILDEGDRFFKDKRFYAPFFPENSRFKTGEIPVRITRCRHVFGQRCLFNLWATKLPRGPWKCPVCRDYHELEDRGEFMPVYLGWKIESMEDEVDEGFLDNPMALMYEGF
ncbi:hypothetical protein F5X68DRAFT_249648 [Plectosphaerella plurivora]|uniref:RING-type domain-containing protein n=1 Tax=Plectosphaerella plurivora TaxID=936078 RepID=A0A9P8V1P8_9PEZI|nr:hypothetical protein F5X68DRAFT_249648 [Plectosphaerella plurivora]